MKIRHTLPTALLLTALLLTALLTSATLWAADAARIVFTVGGVQVAGRPAKLGDMVGEGERLTTQQDGYLYLETLDKGYLILRPNSSAQIVTYHIDTAHPANTRIKLELQSGVARHISGSAVQNARQHFRFNTPVAAVGVRGTDFTLSASADTTRITVLSGGVIVSPFNASCTVGGYGPCEGTATRELFASNTGQMLQLAKGRAPSLLTNPEQTPDTQAPPRPDEANLTPGKAKTSNNDNPAANPANAPALTDASLNPLKSDLTSRLLSANASANANAQPAPARPLLWGRWQAVLDKTIEVDVAANQASHQLIATNAYYALMRADGALWQPPSAATLSFALSQSQAMITHEATHQASPAKLENAQLTLDFAKSRFLTQFDLTTATERFKLQNQGDIASDGRLYGGYAFMAPNNMDVRGTLATDNASAAYLFQARLDAQRIATGVTLWGK